MQFIVLSFLKLAYLCNKYTTHKSMLQYIKSLCKRLFARHSDYALQHEAAPAPELTPPPTKADTNRAAFDANMSFWNNQRLSDKPAPMRERYAAKDGTIYFEYADISDLPVIRNQKLQEAMVKLQFAVTEDYMSQLLIPKAREAIATGDKDAAMVLMSDFVDRYTLAPETNTMLEICALLLIRHDESPYSFNPIIHAQKMQHAAKDYDVQAFFLFACWLIMQQKAAALLELWKIGSEAAFLDYLAGKAPTRKVVPKNQKA
jgi:hypothetical protein